MSTKFSKAILMSGDNVSLSPHITLKHPTIGNVLALPNPLRPDDIYMIYMQIILSDPYANMVMLDDMGKNYLDVSPYDVFVLQWDKCTEDYETNKSLYASIGKTPLDNIREALNFFIDGNHVFEKGSYDDGESCFFDVNNKNCQINREIFDYIYEWVIAINKIDFSNRINPADENARRVLIEDMRDEIKKAKKRKKKKIDNSDYFGDLMSAVCFCGNGVIAPFNIKECPIYWINEAFSIKNKKNHADHILNGIYHGTISSKDINKKDLEWAKSN